MRSVRAALAGLSCAAIISFAASFMTPASAEVVKFVVPFAAGGPVDQWARIITSELGPKLGADIIIDDRGGAGGAIAAEYVAHSTPDGTTVLFGSLGSCVLGPILKPPTAYDPVNDFAPIMRIGSVPTLLVVNNELGVTTMAQLLAKAKQQKLTYGSAGPGTTMDIAVAMFNDAAGVKITHVPYRGAAPAITDLLGDHVDMLNADLPVLMPMVKAGKVKPIALFAPARTPLLPDLVTTKEAGFPNVIMENWYGVLAPAGTPQATRDKLEKALLAVVATPSVQQRIAENGLHDTLDQKAFAARIKQEFAAWPATIHKLGITGE
ncbi:MAG TPA: tripartite tricarboxylate transporter substrate binding protein [Xanthobacteraceae bacterium]|jgi:tripartite-type tricarboxylate transporter receptor subunit TctC|nr:tripartite tricarboxylate transporter substrate binding protein [Xanthobacteraceae bacterium]